jgi:L-fucose mutarotase
MIMLKSKLLHPTLLNTLGKSGHGSQILIADGNYPLLTRSNPAAEHVYLNVMPGLLTVTQVLEALLTATPVEAAHVMWRDDGDEPEIMAEFRQMLPGIELQSTERFAFYEMSKGADVGLAIATGEQRLYANILLTVGVVQPT